MRLSESGALSSVRLTPTACRKSPRPGDQWHLDEVFLKINGRLHYLWRAVDQDGDVLDIMVQSRREKRQPRIVHNQLSDFRQLAAYLKRLEGALEIVLEPTADYHRNLAYFLKVQGFAVKLVSSIAVARTREALHNSWDKNDPKDAQVILHLLRNGNTQYFYDPVIEQTNDLQELSKTHFQISLRKTRAQHSLLNHYLPLYFPEAEWFLSTSRSSWFARLLFEFPTSQAC